MKKLLRGGLAASAGVALALATPALASAQTSSSSYTATLKPVPLNGQTSASGTLTLKLSGNQATISEKVSGLAATFMGGPFPHVQHIHGGAQGVCPTASADTNHDGVINTVEGQKSYGAILTTLSTSGSTTPAAGTDVKIAPSGAAFTYSRTVTLSAASMKAVTGGNAVIVVHGLNPATAPKAATTEKSPLVPSLPLAATAPALCGQLVASQMSAMPAGSPQTGGGSTSGLQDGSLLGAGGGILALGFGALGVLGYRRRHQSA